MADPSTVRLLRTTDLLILSTGTFTLGVDGFVLSGLLPQVAASLHVSASTAGQLTTLLSDARMSRTASRAARACAALRHSTTPSSA
jgi:predicted MFS family arabinose efflux permease